MMNRRNNINYTHGLVCFSDVLVMTFLRSFLMCLRRQKADDDDLWWSLSPSHVALPVSLQQCLLVGRLARSTLPRARCVA